MEILAYKMSCLFDVIARLTYLVHQRALRAFSVLVVPLRHKSNTPLNL